MDKAQLVGGELPLREYETIYVLKPDLTKATVEKVGTRIDDVVARNGGKLTVVESWGRRLLAYPIEHFTRGLYVYVRYLGNGETVSEVERNFRMLDEVVRFQTVKLSDGVDAESVKIDAESLKLEVEEPEMEQHEDITLEERLGLTETSRHRPSPQDDSDDDDDSDDEEEE